MTELNTNIEQLAIELYEAVTNPASIAEFGIVLHVLTGHGQLIMPEHIKRQHRPAVCLELQHMFSGLKLDEGGFMITLSFNQQPETVYIPWGSILGWNWMTQKPEPKPNLAQFLQQTGEIEI